MLIVSVCSYFFVLSSLFTDEEIQAIRNMTYFDVLLAVTSAKTTDIQNNVFFWKDGKTKNCQDLLHVQKIYVFKKELMLYLILCWS